ncbi:HAD-IIIA family hydrolase [Allofrancisella guangzhouensis]|uniref:3-deoxy-D-manno-octulosonate 8-phosphate phosphatase KdsC n=1 Tax=Allofrancisella guangzhouensis TaxID=594679 RepID=A0A0A8E3V5_9GAMM|nr:HAD-IIIA family hydrolase [Allofrancisella guangzhouensis]AJC48910.1 3-deoxy-D-manno-octulosonate 8-phosphate phosphatase [Allofrancisella guangzhouensis]MBK2027127.1 HAD-IIIA family hydrolase [Allofrancisella guangzhouensis]MBK2043788.1 HAD-IIIA family hydrolase [Allofrancisella guangzhouensis]MBK2045635.1 HAD-IIIA family hydrolase [Allofrancisella guangzhouensis]
MKNNKLYQNIRLAIFDVDGVMTDGKIILSNDGNETKLFDVKDGLGLVLLQKVGMKVAIITGKESQIVINRFTSLGFDIDDIFQGQKNKVSAYQALKKKYQLDDSHIAYMGDDLPDIVIMKQAGISAGPSNCIDLVKDYCDYVCQNKGGAGAVREFCEYLLKHCGYYNKIIESYIEDGGIK